MDWTLCYAIRFPANGAHSVSRYCFFSSLLYAGGREGERRPFHNGFKEQSDIDMRRFELCAPDPNQCSDLLRRMLLPTNVKNLCTKKGAAGRCRTCKNQNVERCEKKPNKAVPYFVHEHLRSVRESLPTEDALLRSTLALAADVLSVDADLQEAIVSGSSLSRSTCP